MIDIFKLIVILALLIYFNFKKPKNLLINMGLCLLLFAAILDSTDNFKALDHIPILGMLSPFHDVLEDQFGDTLGIILFTFGLVRTKRIEHSNERIRVFKWQLNLINAFVVCALVVSITIFAFAYITIATKPKPEPKPEPKPDPRIEKYEFLRDQVDEFLDEHKRARKYFQK